MYIQEAITILKLQLSFLTVRQFLNAPLPLTNELIIRPILNRETIADVNPELHRFSRLNVTTTVQD